LSSKGLGLGVLLLVAVLPLAACRKSDVPAPAAPKAVEEDLTAKLKATQAEVAALEQVATAEYRALDDRRAKLAGAATADVEAFNRDAAQYKITRESLQRRQEELKALAQAEVKYREAIAERERPAQELLGRLRAAINANNWNAQVDGLQQALSKFRETQTFAQISAVAKSQFERISRADVERSMSSQPAATELQTVTQQIQAIVNQTPTTRPDKIGGTIWIGFHDGAIKPKLKFITLEQLKAGREFYTADTAWMQGAPNVFYVAREIEFNPMTKYFYTDRTKAKKRLSEAEYDQLLPLYHRLGDLEAQQGTNPSTTAAEIWVRWENLKKSWP
jgi:hypothetical protein